MSDPSRIEQVFLSALEIVSPLERAAFVEAECGDDEQLLERVQLLLNVHPQAQGFLEAPLPNRDTVTSCLFQATDAPSQDVSTRVDLRPQETVGSKIGPYKLLQQLGEGGMGTIFLAEQEEPVSRRVALKIVKFGMNSAQVVARFEQERQALAMMDHPHIATVLDAGTTQNGRPYFVMELVKGIPITQFCDQERLSPRQRLELFMPVCQAIQHAHQKGIIHRDLKPSNVLVALYDGKPVPKVIDFGVAKATNQKLTERTMFTEVGSIVGTLEYMAPEQAELNNLDIDTRADIYSLGVLLYELLTGTPPFTAAELRSAAFTEMLRMIREVEPVRPSTKISSSKSLPTIAANRKLEPRRLKNLVTGELDWIVMKCLEKERQRRYGTVNGLVQDVQRYLGNEPVLAGPPSFRYRARKFLRRNKGSVAAASVCALLLIAGIVGTSWGLVRAADAQHEAEDEARRAEAARAKTRAALDEVSYEAIETLLSQQAALTDRHKAFLRRALELYAEFAEEPGSDTATRAEVAQALLRMGRIRAMLGELSEAQAAYNRAIDVWTLLLPDSAEQTHVVKDLANGHDALGQILARQAKRDESELHFAKAVALLEPLHQQAPGNLQITSDLAKVQVHLANAFADRSERDKAEVGYHAAIGLLKSIDPELADAEARSRLGNAHYNLGMLLNEMGRSAESEAEYQRGIDVYEDLTEDYPQSHDYLRRLSNCIINLSEVIANRKDWEQAEKLHRQGLTIQEELTRDYPAIPEYRKFLGRTLASLADMIADQYKQVEARELYDRAIETKRKLADDYPESPEYIRDVASTYNNQSFFEFRMGNLDRAEAGFLKAIAIQEPLVEEHSEIAEYRQELGNSYGNLGQVYLQQDQFAQARSAFDGVLRQNTKLAALFPKNPEYMLRQGADEGNIAQVLARDGKPEEALEWFELSLQHLKAAAARMPAELAARQANDWIFNTTCSRAMTCEQMERYDEALRDWTAAIPLAPAERELWIRLRQGIAQAKSGDAAAAAATAEELLANDMATTGEELVWVASVMSRAAEAAPETVSYSARCMELLRAAADQKYFETEEVLKATHADPDLEFVRSTDAYKQWYAALTDKPNK